MAQYWANTHSIAGPVLAQYWANYDAITRPVLANWHWTTSAGKRNWSRSGLHRGLELAQFM